jgi:hypothetical protein
VLQIRPDIDPEQIRAALRGEGVFEGTDIQRRRIELVSEIRVFLVVRPAVDVNLVEVVERFPDAKSREANSSNTKKSRGMTKIAMNVKRAFLTLGTVLNPATRNRPRALRRRGLGIFHPGA